MSIAAVLFLLAASTYADTTAIDRKTFSVTLPAGWTEDAKRENHDADRFVFFRGPEKRFLQVIVLSKPEYAVDKVLDVSKADLAKSLSNPKITNIEKWSGYDGQGVTITATKLLFLQIQFTSFVVERRDNIYLIVEYTAFDPAKTYIKDFELIRGTFKIKEPAAEPPNVDRSSFALSLPEKWTEETPSKKLAQDFAFTFNGPESAVVTIFTRYSTADVSADGLVATLKDGSSKAMSNREFTDITEWGYRQGKGVVVDGTSFFQRSRMTIFGFEQGDRFCVVSEFALLDDYKTYAKDFEQIRRTLKLKKTVAAPTPIERRLFTVTLPAKWSQGEIREEDGDEMFVGPGLSSFFIVSASPPTDDITPDSALDRFVTDFGATLDDPKRTPITQWSAFPGKGFIMEGTGKGHPCRQTIFAFNHNRRVCVIMESGMVAFYDKYPADFETIRQTFKPRK